MLDLFAENAYLVVRNLQIIESMIGKKPAEHQMSIFEVALGFGLVPRIYVASSWKNYMPEKQET